MTKKHFEKAARIARDTDQVDRPAVVHAFVELFVDDNPRFDVGRFRVTCASLKNEKVMDKDAE